MINYQTIVEQYGGGICRRCLNRSFNVRLLPRDFTYDSPEARPCPCCGNIHHIVDGFRLTGKLKLLGK